jgi:hypothetical protein
MRRDGYKTAAPIRLLNGRLFLRRADLCRLCLALHDLPNRSIEEPRGLSPTECGRICYSLTMPWSQKFLGEAVQFRDGAVLVALATLSDARTYVLSRPNFERESSAWGKTFEVLLRAAHSGDAIMEAKHQLVQTLKAEGLI